MHYLRDGVFILGWFSLLAALWFWWALEAPPRRARRWLGIGIALGAVGALVGAASVWRFWSTRSMLDGRLDDIVWVAGIAAVIAGSACLILWRLGRASSNPLAVAIVTALHFVPLASLLGDWGLVVLAVGQLVLAIVATRIAKRRELAPSYPVGVVMGLTLLGSAVVAAVLWLPRAIIA